MFLITHGLYCADVPLSNYSLTQQQFINKYQLLWLFCGTFHKMFSCSGNHYQNTAVNSIIQATIVLRLNAYV